MKKKLCFVSFLVFILTLQPFVLDLSKANANDQIQTRKLVFFTSSNVGTLLENISKQETLVNAGIKLTHYSRFKIDPPRRFLTYSPKGPHRLQSSTSHAIGNFDLGC